MSDVDVLSWRQRLGYGVGDLGLNFYFGMATTYLLYFYTDVYGIAPAVAANVLLFARVIDAFAYPLMGLLADRTRSRWGRFRPYLLWGPLPMAVLMVALFSTPTLDGTQKIWWAFASYIAFGLAFTVVAVPYAAITPTLTANYGERTKLSSVRMFCAFAGAWIISVWTLDFVQLFPTPAQGYQMVAAAYALIATSFLWLSFATTRERVGVAGEVVGEVAGEKAGEVTGEKAGEHVSVRASLGALVSVLKGNAPLVVVSLVFVCGLMSFTVRTAAAIYYFKYNLGRADLIGVYFATTLTVMMLGLFGVPALARWLGKAGAVIAGALLTIIGGVGLCLTPYSQPTAVICWCCVMALGGAPIAVMGWSMTADVVDYAQWRTGVRADAVVFSSATFFQQLAGALGGAGVAAMLAWFGYVANAQQTPASLAAIASLVTWVPIGIMLVLIVACVFYRLDAKTHAQIKLELRARMS